MYAGYLDFNAPLVWTVDDVLSGYECLHFIERMRSSSDAQVAPIIGEGGEEINHTMRNNTRIMFDDLPLAALLWSRVQARVPSQLLGRPVIGVNERFRIYRYEPGQRHSAHWDSSIELPDGRVSLLTFMIYLNEVESGGETTFDEIGEIVRPKQGRAVLFQHRIIHTARPVIAGEKLALRSDIFYRRES